MYLTYNVQYNGFTYSGDSPQLELRQKTHHLMLGPASFVTGIIHPSSHLGKRAAVALADCPAMSFVLVC